MVTGVANGYLGGIGGALAIMSVVILSITSGDTAFRSARLAIADYWRKEDKTLKKRLIISACVLSGGIAMSFFDLTTIWTYFGWANQLLATITLWMATFYLYREKKWFWLTLLPAGFMTAVCTTYIMFDKIGFRLPLNVSTICGVATGLILVVCFIFKHRK